MANPTNPFNWQMPTSTDLVTDLPADFETFGQAVATSMADLLGGTSGQVLSKASNTDMDFTWVAAATVADSYGFAAGKNKIINGDFRLNQRNFTSTTTTNVYGFDRWAGTFTDGTTTYTPQTFTPGAAPVAGYEGTTYARLVTTGQTLSSASSIFRQRIEDVRTFAGQTVTVSFWAQSGSGTPSIAVEFIQSFGTGGSPSASVTAIVAATAKQAISTTWTRYSYVISVPSISGKTLGTNNDSFLQLGIWVSAGTDFNARTGSLGIQTNTFNIWGVQVEAGSTATAFQTATGTLQGELAACQRYYYRSVAGSAYGVLGTGYAGSATVTYTGTQLPVQMRTRPTSVDFSGLGINFGAAYYAVSAATFSSDGSTSNLGWVEWTNASGTTGGLPYVVRGNNNAASYIGFSAEL